MGCKYKKLQAVGGVGKGHQIVGSTIQSNNLMDRQCSASGLPKTAMLYGYDAGMRIEAVNALAGATQGCATSAHVGHPLLFSFKNTISRMVVQVDKLEETSWINASLVWAAGSAKPNDSSISALNITDPSQSADPPTSFQVLHPPLPQGDIMQTTLIYRAMEHSIRHLHCVIYLVCDGTSARSNPKDS